MKRGAYNVDVVKAADYKTPYTVCLDDVSAETLRKFGNGNLSAGVRKAADILTKIAELYKKENQ